MLLQTEGPQARSEAVDPFSKLTVGITPIRMDNGRFMGKYKRAPVQKTHRREFHSMGLFCHDDDLLAPESYPRQPYCANCMLFKAASDFCQERSVLISKPAP
jgi:hypothetical protein